MKNDGSLAKCGDRLGQKFSLIGGDSGGDRIKWSKILSAVLNA